MKVDVVNMQGQKVSTADLPAAIFEAQVKPDLMHQALVRQQANARLGTHKTKGRGEVSGGGRKPWRQKGTGRARAGSTRSPIWVGGGKAHTPKPHSYYLRMPRKMRRAALRSALSAKAAQAEIVVLDEFRLTQPRTGEMAKALKSLVGEASALIVLAAKDEGLTRAVRNLETAKTLLANYLNVRDILGYQRLILPLGAVDILQSYLGE
jgi:large subunit ribosomal protein L4